MKVALVVSAILAICAGSAIPSQSIPQIPGDNSHYVEGQSRYIWMPDNEGVPVLVDLYETDSTKDVTKNGENNQYWLYTRSNPNSPQYLYNNNANSIWNSNYNGGLPTMVIVHGWNNDGWSGLNSAITNAFLSTMDCNVIVVDWSAHSGGLYATAVTAIPSIGQHLGNFINFLFNTAGGNFDHMHLVGFSLGAHAVGIAGRNIGGRARRVTGLDPAGPSWSGNSDALNTASGQYVEVIHTDAGLLGISEAIGNVDFYPMGGRNPQPGCLISTCSHGRAHELFASTVQYNHLVGQQCANVWEAELSSCGGSNLAMGNNDLGKWGNGIYHVFTGSAWPF